MPAMGLFFISWQALLRDARASFARKGLYRSRDERMLGGVCAALGHRFQVRPSIARLLFLLVLMLLPGSQLIVYPILWVLLPLEQAPTVEMVNRGDPGHLLR